MNADELLKRYNSDVDSYLQYFQRNVLTDFEAMFAADEIAVLLTNERFVDGIRADIEAFLCQASHVDVEQKLTPTAKRTIAQILTEPFRARVFTHLKECVIARCRRKAWRGDSEEFRLAVTELLRKYHRRIMVRHMAEITERFKTLGLLLVTLPREDK